MKNSHKRFFLRLIIFFLIVIGLLANPWVLGYFLTQDGSIALLSDKIFIWIFQFALLFLGALLFSQRKSLTKRGFLFSGFLLLLIFSSVEAGLHIIHFVTPRRDDALSFDINTDARGFRKTWNPKNFGNGKLKTVYIFGGSALEGLGARDDYTIPSYLSRKLASRGYPFIVYNYGSGGSTIKHEIKNLLQFLKEGHRPDFVVFYDGANDPIQFAWSLGDPFDPGLFETGEEKSSGEPGSLISLPASLKPMIIFFLDHCLIYRTVKNIAAFFSLEENFGISFLSQYNENQLREFSGDFVDNHLKVLNFLDNLSKTFGFRYLLFWQPVAFTEENLTKEEVNRMPILFRNTPTQKYFQYILLAFKERKIGNFHDISDVFQNREKPYYTDWCHVSEEANEVAAGKIAEIFEEKFLK